MKVGSGHRVQTRSTPMKKERQPSTFGDWERKDSAHNERASRAATTTKVYTGSTYTEKIRKVQTEREVGRASTESKNRVHMENGQNKQSRRTGTDRQQPGEGTWRVQQRTNKEKGYLGRIVTNGPQSRDTKIPPGTSSRKSHVNWKRRQKFVYCQESFLSFKRMRIMK